MVSRGGIAGSSNSCAVVLSSVMVTITGTLRGRKFTARTDSGGCWPAAYLIAEAPVPESVRTRIGEIAGAHDTGGLPLGGRNFLDLTLLASGVSRTNTGAPQQFAGTSAVHETGISIAGQRNLNNAFIADDFPAHDDPGLAGSLLSQEVIQQLQVVTSGGNAGFGRVSSGAFNIVTKSGANHWHGSPDGILPNQRLDARNPLAIGAPASNREVYKRLLDPRQLQLGMRFDF